MIIRENYLQKIRPFYEQDLIKVITGIRRCGKSVILIQIIDEIKQNNRTKAKQVWHPCITTRYFYFTGLFEPSIDQLRMVATLLFYSIVYKFFIKLTIIT